MKQIHLVSAVVFTLVAIVHLWRISSGAEVIIDGWVAPMWASIIGTVVPGTLAFMLWKEQKESGKN